VARNDGWKSANDTAGKVCLQAFGGRPLAGIGNTGETPMDSHWPRPGEWRRKWADGCVARRSRIGSDMLPPSASPARTALPGGLRTFEHFGLCQGRRGKAGRFTYFANKIPKELQAHDPEIRELPSALAIQVRAAGDSDAAPSEGRLPGHSDDLLIVDESGHLCAFCYHSEFVDLT
jgi:hypothetical protein